MCTLASGNMTSFSTISFRRYIIRAKLVFEKAHENSFLNSKASHTNTHILMGNELLGML